MLGIYEPATFDLAGVQAAVDAADAAGGGIVWLGPGDYSFSDTLKVGQANAQHHVSIKGINPVTTRILCDTSSGKATMYFNLNKYVTIENIGFINTGAKGGYGLQLGGDNGPGTQTNGCKLDHLYFQNFGYGLSTSGGIGTSSELVISQCVWEGCDYGFYSGNFNGLNYLMLMCEVYDNAIAGVYIAVGNLTVIGGASANNGTDFFIAGGNDGTVKIVAFRAETPTSTWLIAPSGSFLSIEDCIVHLSTKGTEVIRAISELRVRNSSFDGYITWLAGGPGKLLLDGVNVNTPGTDWSLENQSSKSTFPNGMPFGPGFKFSNNQGSMPQTTFTIRDVYEASTQSYYPDVDGVVVARGGDNIRIASVRNILLAN